MIETFVPLSVVALFAASFALLSAVRLRWAIALTIVFLPIYLLRFHVGPLPSTFLEVMLLIVVAVWLIRTTVKREWKNVIIPWRFLLLGLLLAGVLSVLIAPDIRAALGLYRAYLLEPILFFWVFVNVMRSDTAIRLTLIALGLSVLLVAIPADLQFTGLASIPEPYASEVPQRATSIYPFPTAVGKFLGPLTAFFLAFLFVPKGSDALKRWKRIPVHLFVIAYGLWAILISVTHGALLGVFAAVVFISFFSPLKKWIWFGLALVVLASAVIPLTRDEIVAIATRQDTSTDVHLVLWQGAWNVVKANPILGTGLASFPLVYEQYKLPQHVEFFPNPDQFALTLWIELGLVGLLLFIVLFVRIFRLGCSVLRSSELASKRIGELAGGSGQSANPLIANRSLVIGILAAMVALLVHGLVDTPYFKNDLAVQFWVFVGLLIVLADRQKVDA